ncbi:hypothetical protein SSX86_001950 [Deinandra increscens subsp. villosa]|uniref:BRI1 kinase inhibitor 1 n=1 Tax=Deinandra increscens subsp. villosa TaxID=3103831 RepID=A0AAP0E004_9ASTR
MRDKVEDEKSCLKQVSTPLQQSSQNPPPPSSPTHEFSFTISTQHHNIPNTHDTNNSYKTNTTLQPPRAAAIDLSPAGDIFFHGHLLPLHPFSHLPDSPRSSTNSMDSFTLPINLLYYHSNPTGTTSFHCHHQTTPLSDFHQSDVANQNPPPKSKSFSIFSIPKWKKRYEDEDRVKDRNSSPKKLKIDIGQLIKRYMKMVRPVLWRRANTTFNHQSYSFSGNSVSRKPMERRGQLSSAPASMRASPATSGIIDGNSGSVSPTKTKIRSESSMEELHAAIQAAIAHCKQSTAMEDKNQSQN